MTKGLTLIELLIAMAIFSIISVSAIALIFSSLGLRDKTLAANRVQDQLRIFDHYMRAATINASAVSANNNSIFLTSADKCFSFVYDSNNKSLNYSEVDATDCIPDPNPTTSFFPPSTQITDWIFTVFALPTGGRQISVNGSIKVVLPFDTYQKSFSDIYTNIVD